MKAKKHVALVLLVAAAALLLVLAARKKNREIAKDTAEAANVTRSRSSPAKDSARGSTPAPRSISEEPSSALLTYDGGVEVHVYGTVQHVPASGLPREVDMVARDRAAMHEFQEASYGPGRRARRACLSALKGRGGHVEEACDWNIVMHVVARDGKGSVADVDLEKSEWPRYFDALARECYRDSYLEMTWEASHDYDLTFARAMCLKSP